jgi:hypothetical protein
MRDLIGLSYIVGIIWMAGRWYKYKWKLKNPGKPVFKWVEGKYGAEDTCFVPDAPMFTSDPSADKWLSPGGITTEHYSYSSQADEDSRRSHE